MEQAATAQYRAQQLKATSPAMLIAMMYEEAIRALGQAIEAIGENDIQGRWRANKKAIDIVGELATNLDLERGGQIAERLLQLYTLMLTTLPEVDIRNDPKPAQNVIDLLDPLRASWRELAGMTTAELEQAQAEVLREAAAQSVGETAAAEPEVEKAVEAETGTGSTITISA